MNIYAFFDPIHELINNDYKKMIQLWKKSWINQGWNPIILTLEDCKKNPDYNNYYNIINQYPSIHNKQYINLCYLRWLAIANVGGWYTDVDMINYGFKPFDPNDKVVTCSATICPTTLHMPKEKYTKYIIETIKNYSFEDEHLYDKSLTENTESVKNTTDALILLNNKIWRYIDIWLENQCDYDTKYDWNKHQIIHFHGGCFNSDKMKKHEIILEYEKNNRFKNN